VLGVLAGAVDAAGVGVVAVVVELSLVLGAAEEVVPRESFR